MANRKTWIGWGAWLFSLVGDGGIFLGGAAIGVGVVLRWKGERLRGGPGIIILAGLGFVMLTILARLLARFRSSLKAQHAVGE